MPVNKNAQLRFKVLDRCFRNKGRYFSINDLINEGLTDSEASKMMLEMHEEITFLYSIDEGLAGMALKLGGAALGAYGVKKAAEKMGTMSGTPKPTPDPKKPGLIQKLKDRTSATNKAIEQM